MRKVFFMSGVFLISMLLSCVQNGSSESKNDSIENCVKSELKKVDSLTEIEQKSIDDIKKTSDELDKALEEL